MNIKQHLKSKTQLFNGFMLTIDTLVANAAFGQELLTVKQFAIAILVLKVVQTVGNFYLRSVTTEAIEDK
jgi:hypothetical protein